MQYDLAIRNGTLVDGSGLPRYRADVGVCGGRIVEIGRIRGEARETVDAEGRVVAPGFVDGHTHMDAQISWDPLGTCSCWHGVTTVVMGNCGFTLAPCEEASKHLVMRNLERAEDISPEAMDAGIDWKWTTFSEFLDHLDELPKGINYAGYIGHSALRTHVMGERAFEESANPDDLSAMGSELRSALQAGAIGFSTSRTPNHETPDRRPVASRVADWDEVRALAGVMRELGAGVIEIAGEHPGRNPERIRDYHVRLRDLAIESGRPITWGMFSTRRAPELWRPYFDLLDETAAAGGRMFAQVHSRALNVVLSFKTNLPFDSFPVWRELRSLPLDRQLALLRDPDVRRRLVEAGSARMTQRAVGTEARPARYEWIFLMDSVAGPHPSIAQLARERGADPLETLIDLAVEKDLDRFFLQPIANEDSEHVLEMMRHPHAVVTFSDSGAHVSQIMDASLQTHVLSHWVRERNAFTLEEAVRMLSFIPATRWGFANRGLLRPGFAADMIVFDPDTVAPRMPEVVNDLPAGARRLVQRSVGISATIVNGEVVLRDGEHTGAYSGKLLRSSPGGSGGAWRI